MDSKPAAAAALTDGTGVSPLTLKKFIKDLVADFLITFAVAFPVESMVSIPTDQPGVTALLIGAGTALFKAVYRAALRWASAP